MKRVFLTLLIFCIVLNLKSQDFRRKGFFVGIGSHEAIHAGFKYSFKPNKSIYLSYGNFFKLINNEKYWNVTLEYERMIKKEKHSEALTNWSVSPKIIYWRLNDVFYYFKAMSLEVAVGYKIELGSNQGLKLDFGPVFMVVEDYQRLTFLEAGWPKKFMFNGSVKYFVLF